MGNSVTNGQKIKAKLDYIRYAISGKINKHPHINAKNIFMLCSGTWLLVTFSLFLLNYEDRQLKIEEAKIVLKNDPDLERLYRDYNYASIAGIKGVGTVEHFLQSFFQGVAALFLIYLSFVVLKILFPKLTALRIFSVKLDSREKRLSFVHGVAGAFCVFLGLGFAVNNNGTMEWAIFFGEGGIIAALLIWTGIIIIVRSVFIIFTPYKNWLNGK